MTPMTDETRSGDKWPPRGGQVISYRSGDVWKMGVLREVRWGLVWRDFLLEDGRVIPEIKVHGRPESQVWRKASDVTNAEREVWEERLATMAAGGQDPREREQSFRAELNQYLAYTYLRFTRSAQGSPEPEPKPEDLSERIKEAKRFVTGRLRELLEVESDTKECESAAHSLGRLKDLEISLQAFTA